MKIDKTTRIGIAGLGIMGHAFATRLLAAGHPLVCYNRTASRADDLVSEGAERVESPRELAERAGVIIVAVSDDGALQDIFTGANGILASTVGEERIVVNMSTVSPDATERAADACGHAGLHFVDCPVSGSKPQAESGQLILLASGERDVVDSLEPVLLTLGKKVVYAGEAGQGTRLKLAVNLVLAHLAGALAEGVRFSESVALDPQYLLEVLREAPALNAGYFQLKGKKTLESEWSPQFPLKHMLKDVKLAQAASGSQRLPIAQAIERVMQSAADCGYGEEDVCAVIRAL